MKLGGDKKKNIVKGGGKVGNAVSRTAKDMIKKWRLINSLVRD